MALIVLTMKKRRKCKGKEKRLFAGEGKIRRVKLNLKVDHYIADGIYRNPKRLVLHYS